MSLLVWAATGGRADSTSPSEAPTTSSTRTPGARPRSSRDIQSPPGLTARAVSSLDASHVITPRGCKRWVVGIALAMASVSWPPVEAGITPFLIFSQTIPKIAIAPLFLIWFGNWDRCQKCGSPC